MPPYTFHDVFPPPRSFPPICTALSCGARFRRAHPAGRQRHLHGQQRLGFQHLAPAECGRRGAVEQRNLRRDQQDAGELDFRRHNREKQSDPYLRRHAGWRGRQCPLPDHAFRARHHLGRFGLQREQWNCGQLLLPDRHRFGFPLHDIVAPALQRLLRRQHGRQVDLHPRVLCHRRILHPD